MDSPLSLDIQRTILNKAELAIDVYLHFQKQFDLVPKKLCCPTEFTEILNKHFERRARHYNAKIRYERESDQQVSCSLDWLYKKIDEQLSAEITVDYDKNDDRMKLAFRINLTFVDDARVGPEMLTLRKTVVDLHNGDIVDDFYNDSDDDEW
jgi:hypothetical protein